VRGTRFGGGILLLAVLLVALPAHSQWSDDPAVNLAIADRTGGQTLPLIEATPDGGAYVAWFDGTDGNLDVYLQRLDAAGVEQWPHDGILVSNHAQDSALFGWDMTVGAAGHAVLVFSDVRDGGDLDVHAYRVAPDGSMSWGANGITLSDNPDFEPAPRVTQASDGDFVFVWHRSPNVGDADIRMQRLAPDGTPRLAAGGMAVIVSAGESPGFVEIVPSNDGSVLLSYLRDIATFPSPRHVRADRLSATGASLWGGPRVVYDEFSVPIGYFPQLVADGAGGALILWHRSDGAFFNSFVQHLDSAGNELFPHNGAAVSTTANMNHIGPGLAYDPAADRSYVFWIEKNSMQSSFGLYAQRLSSTGARLWGDGGVVLIPTGATELYTPRVVAYADGAAAFFMDTPATVVQRILGMRVNTSGNPVWGAQPLVVSSVSSGKSRYPIAVNNSGTVMVAWEDNRAGNVDIYAQNVNPGGTLGTPSSPGRVDAPIILGKSSATPGAIEIIWPASCLAGAVDYGIYEGRIGDFYSHVKKDCIDDDGDLREELSPGPGDRYYLVVPQGTIDEGSYGFDSGGDERPTPATGIVRCLNSQLLQECPLF